jgi:DNA-binding MarR family transcriptional regulator
MRVSTRSRRHRSIRRRATMPPLLGALLRLAWQRVRAQMVDDLRAAGFRKLQETYLSVFQYPGPDGLRPSDLARQMRMSRQATNYLVVQLERIGYLTRRSGNGAERRRVYLTPRGRRLMSAITASVRRLETRSARLAGGARFDTFIDVLRTLAGTHALRGNAPSA